MKNLIARLLRPAEQKASRTARLIQLSSPGRARWTPRDYAALAREGFVANAIVHRAIKLVAENVGALTFLVYEGAQALDKHPLAALLARPNPRQDGPSFLEAVTAYLLISGNSYIEAVNLDGAVRELYALRPDRMRVVPGPDGWAQAYEYTVASRTVRFEQTGLIPPILHLTLFNPLDDHYGLGALEAAAVAIDTHNAAAAWNKALLDNAARPSGALVYAGPDGAVLSDAQYERLKRELETTYQGSANAGRPLLLEGGLDWKAMSLSPKDMDFMEAKHTAARENRARLRRAAHAARHSRRQHLCQLPGGEPRLLAPHGAAAGEPHRRSVRAMARARFQRRPCAYRRHRPRRCAQRRPRLVVGTR